MPPKQQALWWAIWVFAMGMAAAFPYAASWVLQILGISL